MLDIIVPHYKEPWELGKKLFDMIALQRGIDFDDIHVTLVNDGEENALPEEYFAAYPFPFRQISIPHAGVSAARNAGLKLATEKWVMFCDFDDTFTNIYAVHDILEALKRDGDAYDMAWCELVEEENRRGLSEFVYKVMPGYSCVLIHGKIFRRSFLLRHGIRFREDMRFAEDTEFVTHVVACAGSKRIGKINLRYTAYAWILRPGSTVNSPGQRSPLAYGTWQSNQSACEIFREKASRERTCAMTARTVWDAYNALNMDELDPLLERYKGEFVPWYIEHRDAYRAAPQDVLPDVIKIAEAERPYPERFRADISIDRWLESLGLTP